MTRKYTGIAGDDIKCLLERLIEKSTPADVYRQTMYELGRAIGLTLVRQKADKKAELFVACTVEDADFLAKGIIDVAEASTAFLDVRLACFWNQRIKALGSGGVSAAPIIKRYREPSIQAVPHVLVVVKSIVASGCVVRTNLTNLIQELVPEIIVVATPVMLKDTDLILKTEFLPDISNKFEFMTYAIDDEKNQDGNVEPGIGGNVYERLGFGSQGAKNQIMPELVKTRRQQFSQSAVAKA